MFCSRCGLAVVEGNRFCQSCGQEVGAAVVTAPAAGGGVPTPMAASATGSAPLPYAGFWIRLVAHLVDSLILGIPTGIVVLTIFFRALRTAMRLRQNPPSDPNDVLAMMAPIFLTLIPVMFFLLLLNWLYFAAMESSARQATLGKMAMSLRVTNSEGRRLSFGHATGRFFAKIVSGMIPLALGYIMAGFTAKKQALHDMIAGTLVLKS
jgi:uncharacterized RDD family membrane protein YckC